MVRWLFVLSVSHNELGKVVVQQYTLRLSVVTVADKTFVIRALRPDFAEVHIPARAFLFLLQHALPFFGLRICNVAGTLLGE